MGFKDLIQNRFKQIERACLKDEEYEISVNVDMISDDFILPPTKEAGEEAEELISWYKEELSRLKHGLYERMKEAGYEPFKRNN